jgi:hypothetical protein
MRTPLVSLAGGQLALNADAANGQIVAQILDADGKAIPGFTFADCQPIAEDSLSAPVIWKQPLATLEGQPVRLELSLKNASLFALYVTQ